MPIYEYQCENEHVMESIAKSMADRADEVVCAECGLPAPRVFSRTSWKFGSGTKGSPVGEAIKRVKAKGL